MGWSWSDLMATPPHVIDEAFAFAEETEAETAKETAAAELRLKALQAAAKAKRR
jgi:hypothetical protein